MTLISCICVRYWCRWAGSIWYDPRSKLWYKSGYEVPERFRGKRTACELCLLCLYKPYALVCNKTLRQRNWMCIPKGVYCVYPRMFDRRCALVGLFPADCKCPIFFIMIMPLPITTNIPYLSQQRYLLFCYKCE